jgi:EC042_2821-lke REase
VFIDERDRKRRNVERVEELRDEAIHLFISEVPKDVLGLLQACVLNYHRCLVDWFDIVLSDRVPVGMMTIVFDISPERLDLRNALMRRRLGKDAADYLLALTDDLQAEHASFDGSAEFSVEIHYSLTIDKKATEAAVVAVTGDKGTPVRIVRSARDPAEEYPWRQKEVVPELNRVLKPAKPFTTGDVQAVVAAHRIKERPDLFYQGRVKGNPPQYGPRFVEWFAACYRSNLEFLDAARKKYRQRNVRARAGKKSG